jgi:hypothetical protein
MKQCCHEAAALLQRNEEGLGKMQQLEIAWAECTFKGLRAASAATI